MGRKKIICISVLALAALAALSAAFAIGVREAYGHTSAEHYIAKLPSETADALLSPLGLRDAAIIGYTEYGGQLDGGEYYITVRCDSTEEFLTQHEFVSGNFKRLGAGYKHLFSDSSADDTGYYLGYGTVTLLIQDRDYKNLTEQNELTRRLAAFTAAAEPLFN